MPLKSIRVKVLQERVYTVWFLLHTVPEQERLTWWGKIITAVTSGGQEVVVTDWEET